MSSQQIDRSFDIAKIIGLFSLAGGFIFYAGRLDQKVADHDIRITKIELWKDNNFSKNDKELSYKRK